MNRSAALLCLAVPLAAHAQEEQPDEMSFGEEEAEAPEEMTFEGEAPLMPAVPPVTPPLPARQSLRVPDPIEVRPAARRVVAGLVRIAPIRITAPRSVRSLRGVASAGRLDDIERREPGVFETTLLLPRIDSPRVLVVLIHGEGYAGAVGIPVWISTELQVEAEPGATVTVEIAGEQYGPVRAQGRRVAIPVEVPPGVPAARATVRRADGTEYERQVDLPQSRTAPVLVVPPAEAVVADDGPVHAVFAAAFTPTGAPPAGFDLSIATGALGESAEIQPGLRIYPWRPSRALGRHDFVATVDGLEGRRRIEMIAGPPKGMEIVAEPDMLAADGSSIATIHAGVSDGLGHFVDVGPVEVAIEGGRLLVPPRQAGAVVTSTVASDRMVVRAEPPAAIVVTARASGHQAVAAIRQYDPAGVTLRLSAAAPRLVADGAAGTTLTVETLDAFGAPLPISVRVALSAMGGDVPPEAAVVRGAARVQFRAGTRAGSASIRAELGRSVAHAAVVLDPGPPERLRVETGDDPDGRRGRRMVRARLEDRFGNGVTRPAGAAGFVGRSAAGTIGAFAASPETEGIGWVTAPLELPSGTARAFRVEVAAEGLRGAVEVEPPDVDRLYVGAAVGYAHNLGVAGLVPVRVGLGWLDAFFVPGLLVGLEAGYQGFAITRFDEPGNEWDASGWAVPLYAAVGYRYPFAGIFSAWGFLLLGAEFAWFEVDGPDAASDISSGPVVAFAVGVRLGAGLELGPGDLVLDLTYDDARFDDIVGGNLGGIGAALGYRLRL
ncbi:MAG: hypothetical protein QME96_06305 [Myxococcota bacterium]|nr:hypothetical protein [Myxococcota bacterium]